MTYIVLVTASREWTDYIRLGKVLADERFRHPDMVVRHGKSPKGGDAMAAHWCEENDVPQDPMPAAWNTLGKGAGFARNTAMVKKDPRPDICHAFLTPHAPGTRDCRKKAKAAKILTLDHEAR